MTGRKGQHVIERVHNMTPKGRTFETLTTGIVIDIDDPQQMGRIRALVHAWNDPPLDDNIIIDNVPWATYCSPLAGTVENFPHGPANIVPHGPTSYGMWNVPKRGAKVIVACLDGNPQSRIWLGCINEQYQTNLLPAGRFVAKDGIIDGPLTGTERPFQPLYENLSFAYLDRTGYEWKTRGADYQAAGHGSSKRSPTSDLNDVGDGVESDGAGGTKSRTRRNGYAPDPFIGNRRHSQVYSWTTPGQHAIFMDDRPENCRMKFRTTTGHQIILDDTNERIFVSTSRGKSWIEMDSNGNVDVYAERHLSFHAGKDLNLTADGAVRIRGKGLHLLSSDDMRIHSSAAMNIQSDELVTMKSLDMFFSSENMNILMSADLRVSTANTFISGTSHVGIGGATVGLTASASILMVSPSIGENSGAPTSLVPAELSQPKLAFSTNRVPFRVDGTGKKTWSHGMLDKAKTDKDSSNLDVNYYDYGFFQFGYNDTDNIGYKELDDVLERGLHWRR